MIDYLEIENAPHYYTPHIVYNLPDVVKCKKCDKITRLVNWASFLSNSSFVKIGCLLFGCNTYQYVVFENELILSEEHIQAAIKLWEKKCSSPP